MKRFPKELATAIEPALTAARAVLDELDPDDVPASLRRVVAHSGPRLTPPLAAKLITQLDALDWLRDDAVQRLADDAPAAARAFLEREGTWWADAALAVAEVSNRTQAREIQSLTQRLARQAEAIDAAKAKLKQQKLDTKNGLVTMRDEVKALRKRAAAAEHTDAQGRAALENRIAALDGELAEMRIDIAETEQIVAELRRRLRAQRRELAVARRELESGGSSSTPKDPLLLARELDLAAASVPHRHRDEEPAPELPSPDGERWGLPAGIRPDRAEAVDWLLQRTELTVIIDGYNLLFHLDSGEFTTGKARRQLGKLMGHVVRKAKGAASIRIVFDSALPGHRDERSAAHGVQVSFAEAGRLADEEVVLLAASISGPVVVVSSDREVREEAAAVGAVVLWSEAVVEWFSGQPVTMPPSR